MTGLVVTGNRHAWFDVSAGVAGDMLLGALLDAGADLRVVQQAVDTVVPAAVRVSSTLVTRGGLRAVKVAVEPLMDEQVHRTWRDIRRLLEEAALREPVRQQATAVFARLAEVEAHVHAVGTDDVRFHEVGALDSIADVVGIIAALDDLGVTTLSAGDVALGSGRIRTAHGELPVPSPAVTQLAHGWRVRAGGDGELATPTGMAVLRVLCTSCESLPTMTIEASGVGAGSRDTPGRANTARVLLGSTTQPSLDGEPAIQLEANIDDLDPRLWPGVLAGLLTAGAADAWLVPIVMKKGRPAHTLTVLCHPGRTDAIREQIFRSTTTLGIREHPRYKVALHRAFVNVDVDGGSVAVKVAHRDGVVVQVMPEFDHVAALARQHGRPERLVLQEAVTAAAATGLTVGARFDPDQTRASESLVRRTSQGAASAMSPIPIKKVR